MTDIFRKIEHIQYSSLRFIRQRSLPFIICFSDGQNETNYRIIENCDKLCAMYDMIFCYYTEWSVFTTFNKDFRKYNSFCVIRYKGNRPQKFVDGRNLQNLKTLYHELNFEILGSRKSIDSVRRIRLHKSRKYQNTSSTIQDISSSSQISQLYPTSASKKLIMKCDNVQQSYQNFTSTQSLGNSSQSLFIQSRQSNDSSFDQTQQPNIIILDVTGNSFIPYETKPQIQSYPCNQLKIFHGTQIYNQPQSYVQIPQIQLMPEMYQQCEFSHYLHNGSNYTQISYHRNFTESSDYSQSQRQFELPDSTFSENSQNLIQMLPCQLSSENQTSYQAFVVPLIGYPLSNSVSKTILNIPVYQQQVPSGIYD